MFIPYASSPYIYQLPFQFYVCLINEPFVYPSFSCNRLSIWQDSNRRRCSVALRETANRFGA